MLHYADTMPTPIDHALIRALFRSVLGDLSVELWDGSTIAGSRSQSIAHIKIGSRRTLYRVLLDPFVGFPECYTAGDITIDGDLVGLMTTVYDYDPLWYAALARLRNAFQALARAGTDERLRARLAAAHHYDVGNEFYRQWLDPSMTYTCAYFPTETTTLEAAQTAKWERVCTKLALKPGERVVEAGGGWGALAIHMAMRHGVEVDSYNVSATQTAYARDRAQEAGIADRVRFHERDYRSIRDDGSDGRYHAFVSVGMLEHIGRAGYRELGSIVEGCLAPNGRGLIHTIGRHRPAPTHPWIDKHIFPGGYTPTLSEMGPIFEPNGLAVLDVENLRPHYARTLEHWLASFEERYERICDMVGSDRGRAWYLYLASALAGFRTGRLQLFQVVFSRNDAGFAPVRPQMPGRT